MTFAIKTRQKIKIQGSLETLRHLTKQDTLLAPPHTWEKHCPQSFEKEKKNSKK